MPTSKQRKGFKSKKLKNRKALEASRANKQKVMQNRINAMIEQLQRDHAAQQAEANVTVDEFSSAIADRGLNIVSNEELENANCLAEVENATVIDEETK